jgi:hypothetical protein
MEDIRLATPEEIQKFMKGADLTAMSSMVVFPNGDKQPDVAVIRHVVEMDPIMFSPDSGLQRKLWFVVNLETALRLQGTPEYYCNILADEDNAQWRAIIEKRGAEMTSVAPEFRYKKRL